MKKLLIPVLLLTIVLSGCSTAWLTTLDSVLAAAAPALINILQIAALSKGLTASSASAQLTAKINADAAALQKSASDFASASAAAAPGACAQLQAALTTYQSDLPAVLQVAQVSNANTQSKIETLSALVVGVFGCIEPLIPNCQAPKMMGLAGATHSAPPLELKNFVQAYNAVLVSPVNDKAVDAETSKMKIHRHGKFARAVTLGVLR